MKRIDIAIAVGVTVWMLVEAWAEHLQPAAVVAPLMVVGGLSLAWRRRYPIAVVCVIVSVSFVQAAAGMTMHSAVSPVIALFIASWSVGAYEPRRRAVAGLALLVVGVWLAMGVDLWRGTDHYEGTDFPWIGGLVLAPGVLGIVFGARTRSLRAAEERTRELELERREAIAAERARIARELHDVIAHSVSVMTVQAGAAEEMLKHDPARALAPVRAVQETGREALAEMKRLVGVLKDADSEDDDRAPQPRLADLEELAEKLRDAGQRVELRIEGRPREMPLGVELSAYRVVQEALTNTLKHASGAPAMVTIRYGDDELTIDVSDEGRVFRSSDGGHGLAGMRERVGIFGGTLDAGPRETGGFTVHAVLPLEPSA
jgi:signal transduction histidine kinase